VGKPVSKTPHASSKSAVDGFVRAAMGQFWAGYVAGAPASNLDKQLI
jgi:hypothetical protein